MQACAPSQAQLSFHETGEVDIHFPIDGSSQSSVNHPQGFGIVNGLIPFLNVSFDMTTFIDSIQIGNANRSCSLPST